MKSGRVTVRRMRVPGSCADVVCEINRGYNTNIFSRLRSIPAIYIITQFVTLC